jgi:glyoxylase-like metal-dependent hydrolase (beta-lactamase superfamily II)
MRRATAVDRNPKRIMEIALEFYGCFKFEGVHPLQGGFIRRKVRTERRPGLPIEGPHEDDRFWIDQLDDDGPRWGMVAKSFTPTRWLKHGDTVTVGELTLDVIHCPGHTPGHVVFFHAPSRFAIVGDVLFQGSIGRTDFPKGNHQDLIDSITQRLWPLGEDVMFIPGHGPTSTFGRERKTNAFVSDYALS